MIINLFKLFSRLVNFNILFKMFIYKFEKNGTIIVIYNN